MKLATAAKFVTVKPYNKNNKEFQSSLFLWSSKPLLNTRRTSFSLWNLHSFSSNRGNEILDQYMPHTRQPSDLYLLALGRQVSIHVQLNSSMESESLNSYPIHTKEIIVQFILNPAPTREKPHNLSPRALFYVSLSKLNGLFIEFLDHNFISVMNSLPVYTSNFYLNINCQNVKLHS